MPNNLQDKGFKREFSRKKYFLHFLKKYLGERYPFVETLCIDNLILIDNQHEGTRLNQLFSDIIYKVQNERNIIYFYVNLELQTKVDFTMPMRMFLYMAEKIRENFEDEEKKYRERKEYRSPAVIPIVFYSGRRPWTAMQNFRDYTYNGELFGNAIINFEYSLVCLRDLPDDIFVKNCTGIDVIFGFAKYWLAENFSSAFDMLGRLGPTIPTGDSSDVADFIVDVCIYDENETDFREQLRSALAKGDAKQMEAALSDLQKILVEKEAKIKSEAIMEGIEKGERQGIEKGKRVGMLEAAQKMLDAGAEWDFVIRSLGLSKSEIMELKNK